MSVSYCTLIKNRLWQFKQTLPHNLRRLTESDLRGSNIIVFDFKSDDGLKDYLIDEHGASLDSGVIRYFKLVDDIPFDIPVGKNIAHRLANNEVLFNLDADNFIEDFGGKLRYTKCLPNQIHHLKGYSATYGVGGRIAIRRDDFMRIRGYDEEYRGSGWHDNELKVRCRELNFEVNIDEMPKLLPIKNSSEDTSRYTVESFAVDRQRNRQLFIDKYRGGIVPSVNPFGFTEVIVEDIRGIKRTLVNELP